MTKARTFRRKGGQSLISKNEKNTDSVEWVKENVPALPGSRELVCLLCQVLWGYRSNEYAEMVVKGKKQVQVGMRSTVYEKIASDECWLRFSQEKHLVLKNITWFIVIGVFCVPPFFPFYFKFYTHTRIPFFIFIETFLFYLKKRCSNWMAIWGKYLKFMAYGTTRSQQLWRYHERLCKASGWV